MVLTQPRKIYVLKSRMYEHSLARYIPRTMCQHARCQLLHTVDTLMPARKDSMFNYCTAVIDKVFRTEFKGVM